MKGSDKDCNVDHSSADRREVRQVDAVCSARSGVTWRLDWGVYLAFMETIE